MGARLLLLLVSAVDGLQVCVGCRRGCSAFSLGQLKLGGSDYWALGPEALNLFKKASVRKDPPRLPRWGPRVLTAQALSAGIP